MLVRCSCMLVALRTHETNRRSCPGNRVNDVCDRCDVCAIFSPCDKRQTRQVLFSHRPSNTDSIRLQRHPFLGPERQRIRGRRSPRSEFRRLFAQRRRSSESSRVARSLARIRGDRGQLFFPSSCFTSSITPLFMDPSLVIS